MMNANVFVLIIDYFFLIMEVIKKYYWQTSFLASVCYLLNKNK